MKLIGRPFRDEADLRAILTLVRFRTPEHQLDYPNPDELKILLALPQIQKHAYLWETPGSLLVAYAFLDSRLVIARLHFECHPVAAQSCQARRVLNSAMRDWGKWIYQERFSNMKSFAA